MIINIEFEGFAPMANREVKPGVVFMNAPPRFDVPQTDANQWQGETYCTAVNMRSINDKYLQIRAFGRCYMNAGMLPKLIFFVGVTDQMQRLLNGSEIPVVVMNNAKREGDHPAICEGGAVILRRVKFDIEVETLEQKLAICHDGCSSFIAGPPRACDALKCCHSKAPIPEQFEAMLKHDYGWCAKHRWNSSKNERRSVVHFNERLIQIGDQQIQAVI